MLEGGPTFKSTSAKFPLHFRMKFSEKHTVLATPTDVTTSRTALDYRVWALCPDWARDRYWGNPSTTHTLLAD